MRGRLPLGEFVQSRVEEVHNWAVWTLERGHFESPDGERFERTYVRSPGAVAVVPVIPTEKGWSVVLVKQFRASLASSMLEIPAGMRDVDGEEPVITASRELAEETGYVAGRLELLARMASAPGITDSEVMIYLGSDLRSGNMNRHGPEEAHMEVVHLDLSVALSYVRDGAITDSKTMVGLLMASEKLRGEC